MNHTAQKKYNASEVRITRASVGLFFFMAAAASVWAVSRLRLVISPFMPLIAGVLLAAAAVLGVLTYRAHKKGADFTHRVFAINYIFFLSAVLAGTQLFMLCTMPVDYWAYSVPEAYVLLAICYILYIAAFPNGKDFLLFGGVCALVGFGGMLTYQGYFNPKQNFITTGILKFDIVCKIGWGVLALIAIALLVLRFKARDRFRVWKCVPVLGLSVLYWLALIFKWWSALYMTWIFAGLLLLWFILMCVFKRFGIVK